VGQQDSSRFAGEKQMTKEDIMRMAEASGVEDSLLYEHWRCNLESMTRFAELVASAEREACAKVCETFDQREAFNDEDMVVADDCAKAIRARGQL
jgi:hypothetical protein